MSDYVFFTTLIPFHTGAKLLKDIVFEIIFPFEPRTQLVQIQSLLKSTRGILLFAYPETYPNDMNRHAKALLFSVEVVYPKLFELVFWRVYLYTLA